MGHHKAKSKILFAHFVPPVKENNCAKFGAIWPFGWTRIFARRLNSDILRKQGLKIFSLQIFQNKSKFGQNTASKVKEMAFLRHLGYQLVSLVIFSHFQSFEVLGSPETARTEATRIPQRDLRMPGVITTCGDWGISLMPKMAVFQMKRPIVCSQSLFGNRDFRSLNGGFRP